MMWLRTFYEALKARSHLKFDEKERIVKAAVRKNGQVYTGKRHHEILNNIKPFGALKGSEQGFVTSTGRFVGREEARRIALDCGQVRKEDLRTNNLIFSEELW